MKKKLIILVLLAVIVGGVIAYTQYNKPHRDIASEKASFEITASEIFDAFDTNENDANAKYLDKVVLVSGEIVDLDTNKEDKGVITLEAENAMIGGVIGTLKNTDSELEIGENIRLKCRCTGFLDDVILVDCSIVK